MAIDSRKVLLAALGVGLLPISAQVMAQADPAAAQAAELAPVADPAAAPADPAAVPADAAAAAPAATDAAAAPAAADAAAPTTLAPITEPAPVAAAPAEAPAPAPAEAAPAEAAATESSSGGSESPLREGPYIAPLATYAQTDQLGSGFGADVRFGYRKDFYAIEAGPIYIDGLDGSATMLGGAINGLLFPLKSVPVYALLGAGAIESKKDPAHSNGSYSTTIAQGGLGYLFGFNVSERYEMAVRAEALYRYGHREKRLNAQQEDLPVPRNFDDYVFNLGLQLPLGLKAPPPPPEPVNVVAPVAPPDSDGDGVPDNLDQCPGTPAGTVVDDKGCPVPNCPKPQPGERISLNGCGVGDVIVLNGVNFDFDKARLTANAETILNQVADELTSHADITVELAGHTDSLGSDEYNQRLSDRRAAAVKKYLAGRGIAGDRMTAVGLGESQPVDTNETEEGREHNRRVELKILSGGGGAVTVAPPAGADAAAAPAADAAAAPAADAAAAPAAAEPAVEPLPAQ